MSATAIVENQKARTAFTALLSLLLIFAVVLAAKYGLISACLEWLGRAFLYLSHPTEAHLPSFMERLDPTWIECN